MKQNNNLCLTFQNKWLEKSYMDDSIIKKVELVMAERGLNNTSLGRKLGVSGQRIGLYLAKKRKPKQDFYEKWEEVFGESLIPKNEVKKNQPDLDEKIKFMERIIALHEEHIASLKAEVNYLREENRRLIAERNREKIPSR